MPPLRLERIAVLFSSLSLAAVATATGAPAAPDMPAGWRVIADETFSAQDIEPIARRLGGDIAALRNTVYDVGGRRVQLNLIVARDEANAERIVGSLYRMKSKEFVLKQGLTIYEFVGNNEAIPDMRVGAAHLEHSERTNPKRDEDAAKKRPRVDAAIPHGF